MRTGNIPAIINNSTSTNSSTDATILMEQQFPPATGNIPAVINNSTSTNSSTDATIHMEQQFPPALPRVFRIIKRNKNHGVKFRSHVSHVWKKTNRMRTGNRPAVISNSTITNSSTNATIHMDQQFPPARPREFLLMECHKNHGAKSHSHIHILDGCKKFVPSVDTCLCGCPRNFHRDDYKECLKNHGAKLGTHFLDGCRGFYPAVGICICGCTDNFHRLNHNPVTIVQAEDADQK